MKPLNFTARRRRLGRCAAARHAGQGLVEFALVLPLILVVIAGIVEFGRMLAIYNSVSNASREAARYGSVVGDPGNGAGYYFLDCNGMAAAARRASSFAVLTAITITYDHGSGASFGACTQGVQPNPPIVNGDRVVVTTTASYAPILPLLPIPARTIIFTAGRSIFPQIAVAPACSDGFDNDGDGLIDYPADPGCASAADNDEYNVSPCYILTLTIQPASTGTVLTTPTADPNCPSGQYSGSVRLTASPTNSSVYAFSNWSGSLSGSANPATLAMTSDKAVTAQFVVRCYALAITAVNGSVTPTIVGTPPNGTCAGGYTYGTVVSLSASGDPGYAFTGWSGDLTGSANPASLTIDANKNVTASFAPVACYTLAAGVAAGQGTVNASPAPNCNTKYNGGTTVTLTAAAAPGFQFSQWTDAAGAPISSSNPVAATMNADKTYNANFAAVPCYSLTLTAGSGGTAAASPAPNCGSRYYSGATVTLTAAPATGYSFGAWSGGVSGSTNPLTFTVSSDTAVNASFTANCYTLTQSVVPSPSSNPSAPSAAGSISVFVVSAPNGLCAGYTYNSQLRLTASANSGYTFASWSGAVSGASNPMTLMMPASNASVTARFNANCVFASGGLTASGSDISVSYTNYTGALRNITSITITWPSSAGKLKQVAFGGSVLWSGNANPTTKTISSFGTGNTGLSDAAQKPLTFTFASTTGGAGTFTVSTDFNDGCAPVTVSGAP